MNLPIIGLAGAAGAGKSTLAEAIQRAWSVRSRNTTVAQIVAMADPLKRFCFNLGFPSECLWGPSERRGDTHRVALWGIESYVHDHLTTDPATIRSVARAFDGERETPKPMTARRALQLAGERTRLHRGEYGTYAAEAIRTARALMVDGGTYSAAHGIHAGGPPTDLVVIQDVRYPDEAWEIRAAGGAIVYLAAPGDKRADPTAHESETAVEKIPSTLWDALVLRGDPDVTAAAVLEQLVPPTRCAVIFPVTSKELP